MRPPTPNLSLLSTYIKDPMSQRSPTPPVLSPLSNIASFLSPTMTAHHLGDDESSEMLNFSPPSPQQGPPSDRDALLSPLLLAQQQHPHPQSPSGLDVALSNEQECLAGGLSQIYSVGSDLAASVKSEDDGEDDLMPGAFKTMADGDDEYRPSARKRVPNVPTMATSSSIRPMPRPTAIPSFMNGIKGAAAAATSTVSLLGPAAVSTALADAYDDDGQDDGGGESPPPPKRQRAAPSGPISTKDWVPPDVSGLNKREARLVKNRAAAFLSRQRKREEFEQMEHRVKELEAENARLREAGGSGGGAFTLDPIASSSASSGSVRGHSTTASASASSSGSKTVARDAEERRLRNQLAEAAAREERLAEQLRKLQASLDRKVSASASSVLRGKSPVRAGGSRRRASGRKGERSVFSTIVRSSLDSDDDSSDEDEEEEDDDASEDRRGRLLARKDMNGLKERGTGSVAFMVLLFSLSLLSTGKPQSSGPGGTNNGSARTARSATAFNFDYSSRSASAAPSFAAGLLPTLEEADEDVQMTSAQRDAYGLASRYLGVDRPFGELGLTFGMGGSSLGGLGLENADMTSSSWTSEYPSISDAYAYSPSSAAVPAAATQSSLNSPFSLASAALPSPTIGSHRGGLRASSPAASSVSGLSTSASAFGSAGAGKVELSVHRRPSHPEDEGGASFDLKIRAPANVVVPAPLAPTLASVSVGSPNPESIMVEDVEMMGPAGREPGSLATDASTGAKETEKTVTVHVRKVRAPSSATASSQGEGSESAARDEGKESADAPQQQPSKIVLELSTTGIDADGLLDLNADFEALLNNVKGIPSFAGLGLGRSEESAPTWEIALAPENVGTSAS